MRLLVILCSALFCLTHSSALIGGSRFTLTGNSLRHQVTDYSKVSSLSSSAFESSTHEVSRLLATRGGAGSIKATSPLENSLGWYNYQLEKRPTVTKVVTAGIIGAFSDLLTQFLFRKKAVKFLFDFRRTAVFTSVCALYFAPFIDAWFNLLQKIPFPSQLSGTGKVLAMVAVDQSVGAVLANIGFFFALELAQRAFPPYSTHTRSIMQVGVENVQKNLLNTLKASWCCWPILNFINFKFVPLPYRVLFSNLASVFWNMYIAGVASSV